MGERKLKVTDKRMFTPDGELREEYRQSTTPAEEERHVSEESPESPAAAQKPPESRMSPEPGPGGGPAAPMEEGTPPSFYDLVALLAEPASVFLGDVELPDGRSAKDLGMARLHIDLLDLLREKTGGNLDEREAAVLEDVIYRLRMRFVAVRE